MRIYEEYPYLLDEAWVEAFDFTRCYTAKSASPLIGELDCAVAIIKSGGVVADAASLLGRSRNTVARFISATPHLLELAEEITETFIDRVEDLQKRAALSGDPLAGRFILSTLGKKRGYVTRQEQEVKQATTVVIEGEDAKL